MARVLIVDDEVDLAKLVEFNLRAVGHETQLAHSGEAALELAAARPPDLMLLDLMLPDISGGEVCRRFRTAADLAGVPIIMLTARGDEPDRVDGFLAGADDYVTKPFSVRELVLRVQAVLARTTPPTAAQLLRVGPFELDLASHRFQVDGREVELTKLEFKLMHELMAHPGKVRTRALLLKKVWGRSSDLGTRTVDTHVMRLREKLGAGRSRLETARGIGYRLLDR